MFWNFFFSPLFDKSKKNVCSLFFVKCSWKLGEQLSRSWAEPVLLFCGCVLRLFTPPPLYLRLPFLQLPSHQWFLLYCVNIPNAFLFIYCISVVPKRCCQGCAKHATMGKDATNHSTRKRDVKPNTFILLCLCRPFSKEFLFQIV